jgi:hypothetical protein
MNRKIFSGKTSAAVEARAHGWLADQDPDFDLHCSITRTTGKGAARKVTVTVWYGQRPSHARPSPRRTPSRSYDHSTAASL